MLPIKVIIPCAGYGTRMKLRPHESKEMLRYNGFPIIDYSLDMCRHLGLQAVVITRPEKTELIRHIEYHHGHVQRVIYNPTGEWAQTILDNKDHWGYNNILLLPDTRFSPGVNALRTIANLLAIEHELVFATHKVKDSQNWGIIRNGMIAEKPSMIEGASYDAWGMIGFNKYIGVPLFEGLKKKGTWMNLPAHEIVKLIRFEDVTRGV